MCVTGRQGRVCVGVCRADCRADFEYVHEDNMMQPLYRMCVNLGHDSISLGAGLAIILSGRGQCGG
jgi:hypothetical protein